MVGSSGSGKTTLARAVAARLAVPHVELDAINHLPGWEERDHDSFRAEVAAAVAGDGWVVDGNYQSRLGEIVTRRADAVVWLDYERWLVTQRVVRRTIRRVVTRQELWNGNREPWTNLWSRDPYTNVIVWSWTHHGSTRARYEQQQDGRWIRLRTPAATNQWLSTIPAAASA